MLLLMPAAELAIACLTNVSVAESVADSTAVAMADAAVPGFAAYLGDLMDAAGAAEFAPASEAGAGPQQDLARRRAGRGRQVPLELDLSAGSQPRLQLSTGSDGLSWSTSPCVRTAWKGAAIRVSPTDTPARTHISSSSTCCASRGGSSAR